jgi:hypothetical protein
MRARGCIGLVLCMAWAGYANADPPDGTPHPFWHGGWNWGQVCPSVGCCPDDYVPKPFPLLRPLPCGGGPDDYCRKPLPCVPAVPCGGSPDDYCRKPLPHLLCPPLTPYLQCGSSDGSCSGGGQRR